ncbi:MAG: hypothetical protein AAB391_04040 [Patescibacteria group bacterium]
MTSKFSHFAAVGLLVAAGYSLSLGVDGRQQIVAMSEVVADVASGAVGQVADVSKDVLATAKHLSFANIYNAFGILTGAVENVEVERSAAAVSQVLVVTEADAALSDEEQQALIQDSFSDTVKVVPDATKKSGTIIPVFRGVEGEKYLYVAVPVKK